MLTHIEVEEQTILVGGLCVGEGRFIEVHPLVRVIAEECGCVHKQLSIVTMTCGCCTVVEADGYSYCTPATDKVVLFIIVSKTCCAVGR